MYKYITVENIMNGEKSIFMYLTVYNAFPLAFSLKTRILIGIFKNKFDKPILQNKNKLLYSFQVICLSLNMINSLCYKVTIIFLVKTKHYLHTFYNERRYDK